MKLYEFQPFPNPRRVRMFLAEKGISGIEMPQINVPEGEHRTAEYKAINPDMTVPALQLDDGQVISETVSISRYFEAQKAEPALFGNTPTEQGTIDMWQRRVENNLMNAIGTYFHQATDGLGELELYQNKDWGQQNLKVAKNFMSQLNAQLANNTFIAGNTFSVVDITAVCAIDFGKFIEVINLDDFVNVKRWYTEVSARPSAQA